MYDDFLARILEPDIFLPSQFYGSGGLSRKLEGEKRLMIAILKDAVECLEKYRDARGGIGRIQYQNAIEWVEDTGTEWLFSFNNICEILDINPAYLRRGVQEWRRRAVMLGQQLVREKRAPGVEGHLVAVG